MRKIVVFCCLFGVLGASEQNTIRDNAFSLTYLHATSLYSGDLKIYRFTQGIWGNIDYSKQSSISSLRLDQSSVQSVLAQFGYDYAFRLNGAQSFLGFGVDYSHSWIDSASYSGDANTAALMLYNTFMHRTNFYLHTSLKYIFSLQNLSSSFVTHSVLANLELGYRAKFAQFFFFQPLFRISGGYMTPFLKGGENYLVFGRAGGYLGVDFFGNLKGDLAFGAFFDSDFFLDSKAKAERKNMRLFLALGSNLHLSKNFRLFLGGKISFFGETNTDYGVNLGMRFLFGEEILPPRRRQESSQRNLQDVQREMIYQSNLSRQRVEKRTHLKPNELNSRYQTQERRDSPFVQDELKYSSRQRMIKESSRWMDTKRNDMNYQNRNLPALQNRDFGDIKAYHQRELERKYGK